MVAFTTPNFPPPVETYAVDFETTYQKRVRDIAILGTARYVSHPETKLYLVSIHGLRPDGSVLSYSGPIEQAPWQEIDGRHWVSHNAAFDATVFMEAVRRGQIPGGVAPVEWDCTANLAVFLGSGRSLAAACEMLLGVTVDKTVRDEMNGKTWETMTPEFRQAAIEYAAKDALRCWELWNFWSAKWPAQEVALSRHTMAMALRGVAIDLNYVEDGLQKLKQALWACEQRIPWVGELDAKGKEITVGSRKALAAACVAAGIPPPASTADKNEIFDRWAEQFSDRAPFVQAVKDHRSISRTIDLLQKFRDRTMDDGRMPYGLKYGGAHTLRWSGDTGLNVHNFPRDPLCFDTQWQKYKYEEGTEYHARIDPRGCIYPAPGKKFVIADLKQIEARVTLWYAEDWNQLELLRNGMDVYEAHARATMGYIRPEPLKDWVKTPGLSFAEANMRQIAKARVLGLGFGMGAQRLIDYAKTTIGIVLTPAQAKAIVDGFRRANPGVVRFWNRLQVAMERHAASPQRHEPFGIELPSWRSLEYYDVNTAVGLQARDEMGGRMTHWFGGKLAENVVQATARDILGEAILRIEAAGHPVVMHVHDEVLAEVDLHVPCEEIEALMTVTPEWAPGLPVGSTVEEADRYFK
ncbi:DNA polymerase I family protein with 3'-5'-exonuclease and polymerase domains [Opitutaceae bacterium TAV1]|nr:DNA polymerase I family protein with 3'-5'-exonuclease and polymerase domains [Opitutaceae bacterium TAV1]